MDNNLSSKLIEDAIDLSIKNNVLYVARCFSGQATIEPSSVKLSRLFKECFFNHPERELFLQLPLNTEAWILATGVHVNTPEDKERLLDTYFDEDNYLGIPTLKLLNDKGMRVWKTFLEDKTLKQSMT